MKKLLLFFIVLSFSFADNGIIYFNKGFISCRNGDYTKAAELFQKSCDMGNVNGCEYLGRLYEYGLGVKQNYSKVAKAYKKACEGGNMEGCKKLGDLYAQGKGVPQNYLKAKMLFKKVCDKAFDKYSCINYALLKTVGN